MAFKHLDISQSKFLKVIFLCAVVVLILSAQSGCGKTETGKTRVTVLKPDGLKYLWAGSSLIAEGTSPGFLSPGDINGDGLSDIVISAAGETNSRMDYGRIMAYSTKDGTLIWEYRGRGSAGPGEENKEVRRIKEIFMVIDFDGDSMPDIYFLEDWHKKTAYIISGKTGALAARFNVKRRPSLSRPLRCYDINSDGIQDLLFPLPRGGIGVFALSGKDGALVYEKNDLWPEAKNNHTGWILINYEDINNDGINDYILRRGLGGSSNDPIFQAEYAVFCGKTFQILKRFPSSRPRVGGKTTYAYPGDINRDGSGDIMMASVAGGGSEGEVSFLRAFSGADGSTIWEIAGSSLQGGIKRFRMDEAGNKTELPGDVKFGGPVIITPDINGDNIPEAASVIFAPADKHPRPALTVFSGLDGTLLSRMRPEKNQGWLDEGPAAQAVFLDSAGDNGRPGIAVSGKSPDGGLAIFVFVLQTIH
jgi:hypothetical protein